MISRGQIVDITMVILMFSEMHVFAQGCFVSVFLETWREETRSEGNPRSSKQWKSLCKLKNYSFVYCSEVICFLEKYEN